MNGRISARGAAISPAILSAVPSLPARIIAYLFVGVVCAAGPIVLLIAAGTGIERARFVHSSLQAEGVIVGLSPVRPYRSNTSWRPVFQFTTEDGRSFTVMSNIGQRRSTWKQGEHVAVLYQADHPENAHLDSFAQLWMPEVILGVVGAAFSTIPLLILLRRRRSNA